MQLPARAVVVIGVAFASLSALLIRLSTAPPLVIAAWRMVFAGALTVPIFIAGVGVRHVPDPSPKPGRVRQAGMLGLSGIFLAMHFAAWISSLAHTSVTHATVLVTMHPVIVMLLGGLMLGEPAGGRQIVLAGVSVGGAAVLALGGSAAGRDPTITGDLLAVGGAVAVGMYIILGRWARRSVTAITYSLVVYGIAAAVLVGTAAAVGRPLWPYPAREFVLFFLLALLCTILGHSLISYGLKEVPAGEVSMMILLEPIFATIMAAIWLNELPGIVSVAGAIIVLGALLEATRTDRALN